MTEGTFGDYRGCIHCDQLKAELAAEKGEVERLTILHDNLRKAFAAECSEVERLRALLIREGAWETKDGALVIGKDPVFYPCGPDWERRMLTYPADAILKKDRKFYYSTADAAGRGEGGE